MMRKCCGYYCAMIAAVGIFFYGVIIIMEMRKNQFVLYKLQYPEGEEAKARFEHKSTAYVRNEMNHEADEKVTSLAIAIGLNVLCIVGCLIQVKLANNEEAKQLRKLEKENALGDDMVMKQH